MSSDQPTHQRALNQDILPWTKITDLLEVCYSDHPSQVENKHSFEEISVRFCSQIVVPDA